ncbi:MAG: hypothetical protein RBR77_04090 [Thauera sp.]|jgi:hypothetical protein|nr:hypothetical protein [Thauera sp.]
MADVIVIETISVESEQAQEIVTSGPTVVEVVTAGTQGPPGPPGPIGPAGGSAFERVSAGPLSALRVVWEDESGTVRELDYRDGEHIDLISGLTITSASETGEVVTVQRAGPLDIAGLGLTPGRVWIGIDGALTQTPPSDGYDVLVGYATAESRLYLDFSDCIQLEV